MKLEIFIGAIVIFFAANIYFEGKLMHFLKSYSKYYKMGLIGFVGLCVYLYLKRSPQNAKEFFNNADYNFEATSIILDIKLICLPLKKYNGIINCGSGNGISLQHLAMKIALQKFSKNIQIDKRFKIKKPSKIVCNNYKLIKITGIKNRDNLMKII